MKRFFMILAFVMATTALYGQSYDLKRFPEGCEPQVIGEQLVKHYLETPHSHWGDINSKYTTTFVTYPDVCTWLGSLWFATATKNEELYKGLVDRFEPLFGEQKNMLPEFYPKPHNVVDWYVFGAVPLEIYKRVKDQKYLDLGLKYADLQWVMPENPTEEQRKWQEQDYSWQTRLWIDDMFMITAVQAQAYLVTGDEKYMDRASREMVLYLDSIQRPNGLFHHASNVPYFWGRGDGWMAVGMAEMLRMMPKDSPYKERVMESYKLMMKTLLRYQGYDGMWTQIIDDPNSWNETASTAMFTYAMIVGVKNGWLDKKTYGAAARKAYISLLSYLDENWNIRNVCEGTGARNNYKYYLTRRKLTGDLHGQAALIWCCYALSSDVKPYKMTK